MSLLGQPRKGQTWGATSKAEKPQALPTSHSESLKRKVFFSPKGKFKGFSFAFGGVSRNRKAKEAQLGVSCTPCLSGALCSACLWSELSEPEMLQPPPGESAV